MPLTASRSGPAPADWVPVDACTLPTADQPLRMAEFDDLFTAVERPAGATVGARLLLAGDAGLPERVQRLADAETSCCSFFTFTVTSLPGDDAATAGTRSAASSERQPGRCGRPGGLRLRGYSQLITAMNEAPGRAVLRLRRPADAS
ncbi:hypothetical protein [Modestobacter excelsi]|uniref:hypothetical protein n=1 Tax=Modestobacter excelsi TaxID=2213161 RepID=UPI00110CD84C|nr:hypothetical protein [Modestobacter excelsi]